MEVLEERAAAAAQRAYEGAPSFGTFELYSYGVLYQRQARREIMRGRPRPGRAVGVGRGEARGAAALASAGRGGGADAAEGDLRGAWAGGGAVVCHHVPAVRCSLTAIL